MFGMKHFTIARHERGLLFRDRSFEAVLEPGVYRHFDPRGHVSVITYDLSVPEFVHPRVDFLVKEAREAVARYFTVVELGRQGGGSCAQERQDRGCAGAGHAAALLAGSGRGGCRGARHPRASSRSLRRSRRCSCARKEPLAGQVADAVISVQVPDTAVGLLIVDGKLTKVLEPGLHAFWKYHRAL